MSYQDTLAQIARLKGLATPALEPDRTDTSPSVSSVSTPDARFQNASAPEMVPAPTAESGTSPTEAEREKRANQVERLYRSMSEELTRTIPREVSAWPPAWPVIEPPAYRMFETGHAYAEGRTDRTELLRVAREVRHAWWEAAALYKQAQREAPAVERAA